MLSRRPLLSVLLLTASSSLSRAFRTNLSNLHAPSSKAYGRKAPLLVKKKTTSSDVEGGDDGSEGPFKKSIRLLKQIFLTQYTPDPTEKSFLSRIQEKEDGGIKVKVAVLGDKESRRLFGVSLDKCEMQPCYIEVDNTKGDCSLFFDRLYLDPDYYPPLEAATACHFASLKTLLTQGFLSWLIFFPLAILLPLKLITAGGANEKMDEYFCSQSFPPGLVEAGSVERGFVFTSLDIGTKVINVGLVKPSVSPASAVATFSRKEFVFNAKIPRSVRIDSDGKEPMILEKDIVDCSEELLKARLIEQEPRAVFNSKGTKEGDPVNLVVVGEFSTVLAAFGTRWDETETTGLKSSIKTVKSFVLGSQYKYSPISPLFMYGRSQDFSLQRARGSINQRLHLRLWMSSMRFEDKPVWVGQVSRDIGVRLAMVFPGTTHKIDPNVDEARDYVVADLIKAGRVDRFAYVEGVGESTAEDPRGNLTGDPYVTTGKRAVIMLSPTKTSKPKLLGW